MSLVVATMPGAAIFLGSKCAQQVGKLKTLEPAHFVALSHAAFIPHRLRLSVGLNRERLLRFAARAVLQRQRRGLSLALANGAHYVEDRGRAFADCSLVLAYSHEWDETRSTFRDAAGRLAKGYRASRMGVAANPMAQRGARHWSCEDFASGSTLGHCEQWLCSPFVVPQADAETLLVGLETAMPSDVNFLSTRAMVEIGNCCDCMLFLPIGDQASSNVRILRAWAMTWQFDYLLLVPVPRVLLLPETCMVHSHHRGKLSCVALKSHTMKLYSLVALEKLPMVQSTLVRNLESLAARRSKRIIGVAPLPTHESKTWVAFDRLFQ